MKLHLFEEVVSTLIIWNSFLQEMCFSHVFIYLFNGLSVSLWTHRYLFHTLWCNPMLLFNLLHKLFQFWPWKLFWVGCFLLFGIFPSFYFLSTSFLSSTRRFSRVIFIFSAPAPDSDIFPRILVPFTGKFYEKPRLWCWMFLFYFLLFILASILWGRYWPVKFLDVLHYKSINSSNEYEYNIHIHIFFYK